MAKSEKMEPSLSSDKKLQGFQLVAQEKLQAIICSIPGKKDLILEQALIKPLEHICGASWLKLKGIQRIYKFDEQNAVPPPNDQVQVFVIHSCLKTLQMVLHQVQLHTKGQRTSELDAALKAFHVVCVPNCFAHFQRLLEEEGFYGVVQLHRFNWDFIYLDQGVLSMEVPNVFASVFLHEDSSLLPSIAHTLRVLRMICGRPEVMLTFGQNASNIARMLNTLTPAEEHDDSGGTSDFSAYVIIDRDKDYASTLLTPTIYAGLLLEVFRSRAGEINTIENGKKIEGQKLNLFALPKAVKDEGQAKAVNKEFPPPLPSPSKASLIRLNSVQDEIYGENRYKHFAQASGLVRAQAKVIGLEVQKLNNLKLDEMHDYVARKLPKITELKSKVMRHLNASEKVIEMLAGNFRRVQSLEQDILNNVARKRSLSEIDELLTIDGQQYNVLRLFCLLHICAGVTVEELTQFMWNYCNYFGLQHLHIFHALAQAGLLPVIVADDRQNKTTKLLSNLPLSKFQQTEFQANANRLRLLVTNDDGNATAVGAAGRTGSTAYGACPSYVFNGMYIPLVAQLCALLLKANGADDVAAKLGMLDQIELYLKGASSAHSVKTFANGVRVGDLKDVFPLRMRSVFVFIVGGATYAEIGACDFVARLTGAQICVASDSILAGVDLIASAF